MAIGAARMDDKPDHRDIGIAIEFWVLTVIVGGSLIYGISQALF